MSFWTRVAIAVLIVVPPMIFVLFLRDAGALLRDLRARPDDRPASAGRTGPGGA